MVRKEIDTSESFLQRAADRMEQNESDSKILFLWYSIEEIGNNVRALLQKKEPE